MVDYKSKLKGIEVEEKIAFYLTSLGYKIISRNFIIQRIEFDIIASKGNELFFFEVKARKKGGLIGANEAITATKRARLYRGAEYYLARYKTSLSPRIALIAVDLVDGAINGIEIIDIE